MVKVDDKGKEEIRRRYANENVKQIELAREYGISQGYVSSIVRDGEKE